MKQLSACLIWSVLLLGVAALAFWKLSAAAVRWFGDWAFEGRGP